jgi:hypothetical protein
VRLACRRCGRGDSLLLGRASPSSVSSACRIRARCAKGSGFGVRGSGFGVALVTVTVLTPHLSPLTLKPYSRKVTVLDPVEAGQLLNMPQCNLSMRHRLPTPTPPLGAAAEEVAGALEVALSLHGLAVDKDEREKGVYAVGCRSVRVEVGGAGGVVIEYGYMDLELTRMVWECCCKILGVPDSHLPMPAGASSAPAATGTPGDVTAAATPGRAGAVKLEPEGQEDKVGVAEARTPEVAPPSARKHKKKEEGSEAAQETRQPAVPARRAVKAEPA